MEQDKLLDTKRAAELFSLSPVHFKRLVDAGKLPQSVPGWIGCERRWSLKDLQNRIEQMKQTERAESMK